jgi:hypothetical protein
VLGLQDLHIKVAGPVVPQYWVALGSEGNTGTGTMRQVRCGAWGNFLADGAGGRGRCRTALARPFLLAPYEQANIRVSKKNELISAMRLHPTDNEEATGALIRARWYVWSV